MNLRVGIDVGGTNTDAVVMDESNRVVVSAKRSTTPDIHTGVTNALATVLAHVPVESVNLAMLGTTQCTNAVVQRHGLRKVGILRLGAPATTSIRPLADWPRDLAAAVLADARVIAGGSHFDGRDISPLDTAAVRRAAQDWAGHVEAVAITAVFSPTSAEQELLAHDILREHLDVPLSLSHRIGSIGLLERENATVLNAALTGVAARASAGFVHALQASGIRAAAYLSQNDGTLMTLDRAADYPVLTVGSGPTNSLRGGALLSGCADAIVIDVGGTTADIGAISRGFPRESGVAVEVGGVTTNFRMPDLVSVALGGGTIVDWDGQTVRLGPESVGYEITRRALAFGGETTTLTDVAIAAGTTSIAEASVRPALSPDLITHVAQAAHDRIADALDRMRLNSAPVAVVAVGGGSFLVPDDLPGAREVVHPKHHEVANAVGAAIAEVSGEVDQIVRTDRRSRTEVREEARAQARAEAVRAGAAESTVRDIDLEEFQLAYLPGDAVRIRARAAGQLAAPGRLHADAS